MTAGIAWLMILAAGAMEIVWAYSAKQSEGWTNWRWGAVTIASSLVSFVLLTFAMKSLPLGTAYAVWTGIGAVGSFILGIWLLGESANVYRVGSALLVVVGIVGMRLSSGR